MCQRKSPIIITATGVRFLGRGVAIELSSDHLDDLRTELARAWSTWLSPQDRRRFRAHVTIQNKVTPAEAKALHTQLQNEFDPMHIEGSGLCLWRYKNGPWEELHEFTFASCPVRPLRL